MTSDGVYLRAFLSHDGRAGRLIHLSLARYNLRGGHIVLGWSGEEGMNGCLCWLIQEEATWDSSDTGWHHFLHNLKGKHASEVGTRTMVTLNYVWAWYEFFLNKSLGVEEAKSEFLDVIKNHLWEQATYWLQNILTNLGCKKKKGILFRDSSIWDFLVCAQRCFWVNDHSVLLSIALGMNEPFKCPQCTTQSCGEASGRGAESEWKKKTEISAWQTAHSAAKAISSSETAINIKLNLHG